MTWVALTAGTRRAVDVPGAVARPAVVGDVAVGGAVDGDVGAGSGQPPSWVAESGPIAAKVVVRQAARS